MEDPKPLRILVVDDNPDSVEVTMAMLGDKHIVFGETNPLRAVELMRGAEFDLVVTDWSMPHVTGTELVAWIRGHQPEVGCILMTGRMEDFFHATATGDRHLLVVLSKPVSGVKLEGAVESLGKLVRIRRASREREQS